MEILEERPVLFPAQNMELERISDSEKFSCVWLQNGDVKENYREVPLEERQ